MNALRIVSALAFVTVIGAGCSTTGESVTQITMSRANRDAPPEPVIPPPQTPPVVVGQPIIIPPVAGLNDPTPITLRACLRASYKAEPFLGGGARNYADVRVDDCDNPGSEFPVDRLVLIWHEGGSSKNQSCDHTSICVMHKDFEISPVNCAAGTAYINGKAIGSTSTNLDICGRMP